MKILAIESSCDETAAAVVEDGRKILSNIIYSQIETHKKYGGVVPEIASRKHIEKIDETVSEAILKSGTALSDIDAVAVTFAPGLIGSLLVGVNFAKALSYAAKKPLIPVHHIRGHIAANYLASPDLKPPFLALCVSGGHSHIIGVEEYTRFKVYGKTRDDAAGEAFDKTARVLSLGYPGGVVIDEAARGITEFPIHFPVVNFTDAPYDMSFSGVKTAVINYVHNAEQKGEEINKKVVAACFQDAVARALSEKFVKCAVEQGYKNLALGGGVAANSVLRERLKLLTDKAGLNLYLPPLSLCGDNAAMIASQGYYEAKAGKEADFSLNAKAVLTADYC